MVAEEKGREGRRLPEPVERAKEIWRSVAGHPLYLSQTEAVWHPLLDVYDHAGEVVVQVELPGMKGREMSVSLDRDHLLIEGSRAATEDYQQDAAYYCERPVGRFHRIIHLPCAVDEARVTARYEDGVLTVVLPKGGQGGGRRIRIA